MDCDTRNQAIKEWQEKVTNDEALVAWFKKYLNHWPENIVSQMINDFKEKLKKANKKLFKIHHVQKIVDAKKLTKAWEKYVKKEELRLLDPIDYSQSLDEQFSQMTVSKGWEPKDEANKDCKELYVVNEPANKKEEEKSNKMIILSN